MNLGERWKKLFGIESRDESGEDLRPKLINEATFVVIDLETSGLDVARDKVLSFGGIKVINGSVEVAQSMEMVFRQSLNTLPQNNESIKVHGLLKRDTEKGREKGKGVEEVLEFIGKDILVGHHVDFDYLMLQKVMEKYLGKKLSNPRLDTAALAARIEHGAFGKNYTNGDYTLDKLCERYRIEPFDRHTAAGDAFITAQLLTKLLSIADRKGIKTIGQLLERKRTGLF
jgi:DNA polymerase-3 subunit epsilon